MQGSANKNQTHTCPVCGNDKLKSKPYQNMPPISPALYEAQPPYENLWGKASYEVCGCCGFEFGNDDNGMDPELNSTFASGLMDWLNDTGGEWFWPEDKPANWSLSAQIQRAGIPLSDEAKEAIEQLDR